VPLPDGLDTTTAAFAEPLAVCLHAARQAGPLLGRRVLVTGCGPIGVLAIAAARMGGAREVVATDLSDAPKQVALRLGADRFHADGLDTYASDKGFFDVALEASGSPRALLGILPVVRPGGTIVQIGIGGDVPVPMSVLAAKEITWRGTFRFHAEFAMAVEALAARRIDVAPLLTERFPIERAAEAFALAADRTRAMKVQIAF
jgi:L-idonate 5-dehydrogenase